MPSDDVLAIARIVRDRGPISRAEIARRLKISPSTVGRAVDYLLEVDLVYEPDLLVSKPMRKNAAGRPSIPLAFNARKGTVLSVDLRLTDAYAAVTDLNGIVLAGAVHALTIGNQKQSVSDLMGLIHSMLVHPKNSPPVSSIIIGAPSIVEIESGAIEWAPSLGWENLSLGQMLEQEFGLAVRVENDVNLTALGEFWKGAGRAVRKNMVFVSVGTGIGAGIIIDGLLYRGSTHAAGEVAYFLTDVNVLRDNAGQFGNLDRRVGRDGLIRMAQLVAQRYPASQLAELLSTEVGWVRTRDILALAEAGDQAALVVYNELVDILTLVICNISVVLDPELVVLGGPSDWKWSRLIPDIQHRVGSALLRPIHLKPSELGNDALIMGGAYAALDLIELP